MTVVLPLIHKLEATKCLRRGVTSTAPDPAMPGGGEVSRGPLLLGKRNFSTRPYDVAGVGVHMAFSAGRGQNLELGHCA